MKAKNIIITGMVFTTVLFACKKDDTTTPVESFTRADYVGSWSGTEIPVAKNLNFDCKIFIDATTETNIKISNFAGLPDTVFAVINGKNAIIPRQVLINTIEGYGTMDNSKKLITWHYYVVDKFDSIVYNATFNKN